MKINQLPHRKHIHEFCTTDFVVSIFVKYFDQVINFSVINFLSKVVQSFFQLPSIEKCSEDSLLDQIFFHLLKNYLKMALSQRGWLKFKIQISTYTYTQKYSKLRCLLGVKGLLICFYLDWSGSKSWLLTCSNDITLSVPSYNGSGLKRELNFCNLNLHFWAHLMIREPVWGSSTSLFHGQ